ncbi:MAG TPA: dCTP deaminase [Alphaproteobacteria bacterium]|jgi:dCTP deaminase
MILSRVDLEKEIGEGRVKFDPPLVRGQLGPASIDLRLGRSFTKLRESPGMRISVADGLKAIGDSGLWVTKDYPELDEFQKRNTFVLEPREFVLALTLEKITIPNHLIALVEGRSTYARMGLSMHQTAPWLHPGWSGPIILEVMNNGPVSIELTPGIDRPCQLTFFELKTALSASQAYGSGPDDIYQDQKHPLVHKRSDDG